MSEVPGPAVWADGSEGCAGRGDLFAIERPTVAEVAEMKAACGGCRVRRPCLAWALVHAEWGVWGGLDQQERRALVRRAVRNQQRVVGDVEVDREG